jgi:hypothetical protein
VGHLDSGLLVGAELVSTLDVNRPL